MKTDKKIKLVKKAIRHYKWSIRLPFLEAVFHTHYGMCEYFGMRHMKAIPEILEAVERLEVVGEVNSRVKSYKDPYSRFWFPTEDLKSRLKVLKKTLVILKKQTLKA